MKVIVVEMFEIVVEFEDSAIHYKITDGKLETAIQWFNGAAPVDLLSGLTLW